jgi:hypothetical protein
MNSHLEQKFSQIWTKLYPDIDLHSEFKFCSPRRFRFDFAHIPSKTAIEIQGAIWTSGRHSRGSGLIKEYEKMNLAAFLGWKIFYLSTKTIEDLEIYGAIAQTIRATIERTD